jgi:hypothetical protein
LKNLPIRPVGVILRLVLSVVVIVGGLHAYRCWQRQPKVSLEPVLAAEAFTMPVMIREFPDHEHVAVVEKTGVIRWYSANDERFGGVIMDLSDRVYSKGYEEGMLSIAFDPNFARNRFIYVFYSLSAPLRSKISRFELDEQFKADLNSELILFEIAKPREDHNGGLLEFGPDGFLYIAVGEGRFVNRADADRILMSKKDIYGAILRIDVSRSNEKELYRIPSDNPFAGDPQLRGEIWAYGFRNPWRFSFDVKTGNLYANDVGGVRFEEVIQVEKGKNYGWPIMEGEECRYSTDHDRCDKSGKELAIGIFSHADVMKCITSGYVYRGKELKELVGMYVFTGFDDGIFAMTLDPKAGPVTKPEYLHPPFAIQNGRLTDTPIRISAMSEDHKGELYLTDYEGKLFKLIRYQNPHPWLSFFDALMRSYK